MHPDYYNLPEVQWLLNFRLEDDVGGPLDALSAVSYDSDVKPLGTDVLLPHGYDQLCDQLIEPVLKDVRFKTIVTRIEYEQRTATHAASVTVYAGTQTFRGDAVLVTVPLGVLQLSVANGLAKPTHKGAIEFVPPLPPPRVSALRALKMGAVNRIVLVFATAFWPATATWIGIDTGNDPKTRGA